MEQAGLKWESHPPGLDFTIKHVPFVPGSGKLAWAQAATQRRMAAIAEAWWKKYPAGERRLLWLQHPIFWPMRAMLKPDFTVLDAMDPYHLFENTFSVGREYIGDAILGADVVLAGGTEMTKHWPVDRPDKHIITTGVEIEHFSKAFDGRPGPRHPIIIGYMGSIDERIDFVLIEELARNHPDWTFDLAGPINCAKRPDLANIRMDGAVHYANLPERMATWTVATLPFLDTPLCRALAPTKIGEYLAAGLPVVSTPLPDVVREWGDFVGLANDLDSWDAMLEEAVALGAQPLSKSLTEALRVATWDGKFKQILSTVNEAR